MLAWLAQAKESSGSDWTTALAIYGAIASTVSIVVSYLLWRRSGPALRVDLWPEVRIGAVRVRAWNRGRMPVQIRWVELVGIREDGQRVAAVAGKTYATNRDFPFMLDAHAAEEWKIADWNRFVKRTA